MQRLPPRRLFARRRSVCSLRDALCFTTVRNAMSLRLALRAGRLARQLPARQAAVGTTHVARRLHASPSTKSE